MKARLKFQHCTNGIYFFTEEKPGYLGPTYAIRKEDFWAGTARWM